jgi:hypothetical protein
MRQQITLSQAEATGRLAVNPARFAARAAAVAVTDQMPALVLVPPDFLPDEVAMWNAALPHHPGLTEHHRIRFVMMCRLQAEYDRDPPAMKSAKLSLLARLSRELGEASASAVVASSGKVAAGVKAKYWNAA